LVGPGALRVDESLPCKGNIPKRGATPLEWIEHRTDGEQNIESNGEPDGEPNGEPDGEPDGEPKG
jgi:hypothetical protein